MKKHIISLFLWLVVVFASIWFASISAIKLNEIFARDFKFMHLLWVYYVVRILVGFALGSWILVERWRQPGKWKIDYLQLCILGIPLLYCTFYLYFPPFLRPLNLITHKNIMDLSAVAFGYIVITCFKKHKE